LVSGEEYTENTVGMFVQKKMKAFDVSAKTGWRYVSSKKIYLC